MGCNCGKRRAAARPRTYDAAAKSGTDSTQVFSLILPNKEPEFFGSRLEADAANARAGYTGVVRVNRG